MGRLQAMYQRERATEACVHIVGVGKLQMKAMPEQKQRLPSPAARQLSDQLNAQPEGRLQPSLAIICGGPSLPMDSDL